MLHCFSPSISSTCEPNHLFFQIKNLKKNVLKFTICTKELIPADSHTTQANRVTSEGKQTKREYVDVTAYHLHV